MTVHQHNHDCIDVKVADHAATVHQKNYNCNAVKAPNNVNTFLQVNIPSASKTKKIWEYILSYILVFIVGMLAIGILGIIYIAWSSGNFNHIDQNILKASVINDQTSPFVGISFMVAGLGLSTLFGIIHWLIKLPNLRQQRRDTN